ncbi:MAG TPA: translocation/assembly module TamB domain-containing protein [Terracidiphilus sp.]|nr:translocation/assembly module TamB domain-containing protein [Terracidiphilus sp.]
MSDLHNPPPGARDNPAAREPEFAPVGKPHRVRRLAWIAAGSAAGLAILLLLLYAFLSSSAFENLVRERLIASLENSTGGRVQIASFRWRPLQLEADASGIVLHGREAAGEEPYARIDQIHAALSVLGLWNPHIRLRALDIVRPAVHLIVYPDGSTNQPQPPKPASKGKLTLNTLFDLHAGRIALRDGTVHYEDRAAGFDFQNRNLPLNLTATDTSLRLVYVPAGGKAPETYRIECGARDLSLVRGNPAHPVAPPVSGLAQATLDLTRTGAYLRSLRLTTHDSQSGDHALMLTGSLVDFAHPRWQARAQGQLDMRLLNSITGYPNSPEGLARLDLAAEGHGGVFHIDGPIHVDHGSYVGGGINARNVTIDAHFHADPEQMLIANTVARFRQGGRIDGEVALNHWLGPLPGTAVLETAPTPPAKRSLFRFGRRKSQRAAKQAAQSVATHLDGKVIANFHGVPMDTVLDIVSQPPFQRLGIGALLTGPATATWTKGDVRTLAVTAKLALTPSTSAAAGQRSGSQRVSQPGSQRVSQPEVPTSGVIDATYTQRDGGVNVRALSLVMPASTLKASGHLGAYPLRSASQLNIDLDSHDLTEFDRVLRDLGLHRDGKDGVAALPVTLAGEARFHGLWTGSLINPHLTGALNATNLVVDLPAPGDRAQPQTVRWDSLEATGSYASNRIAVDHARLEHGPASIELEGTLAAAAPAAAAHARPGFDGNSILHLQVTASQVDSADLIPFLGRTLPVAGRLSTQFQAEGRLHTLQATGWAQLDHATLYGEPLTRIRAQGTLAAPQLDLTSLTLTAPAGTVTASGGYNFHSHQFTLRAQGAAIQLAKLKRLENAALNASGTLGFTVSGSGTLSDPRLTAHGQVTRATLAGETLGSVDIDAHTANRTLIYSLGTHFESADLALEGHTALSGDLDTQATLRFSRFDIGIPLKIAHVPGLTGKSALAGTVTLAGPLRKPDQLRGEASLKDLALTVVGVHLRSQGPVHAALANQRISLDPIHITGEETDIHLQGDVDFKSGHQLNLAASGSVNLKLAETLDPDLTASGTTTFQVEAHGTFQNPDLRGRIDFQNASLALEDLPNSLSQLHGTLVFNQNRLEIRSLTATTGGGQLSVAGYLAYQHGIFADLSVTGQGVRIRYPQGVSSLADATLHLQGSQNNLLLSGKILITRFTVSPDLDIVALAAQAGKIQPVAPPDAPSNHIRLDVRIQSSPQLNFQNAYAKLAGDVDLHLRGTLATPSLLGRVSITEGNATIAGTRYELQRGDITFTNPVRIEPSIDLNATAHVQDYDVTLGIHGSLNKLNISYHSDPPLPESDVIALLALGRTQNEQRIYTQQQEQVAANTTDALLGGALNATVSSRVQRLFGSGSVKVDPSYLGALGNSTTRITVEEQVGRNVTLTYATNVNTTAQQLLQAEIAINHHVSLLVTRDESGVFSMVIKATRRYR